MHDHHSYSTVVVAEPCRAIAHLGFFRTTSLTPSFSHQYSRAHARIHPVSNNISMGSFGQRGQYFNTQDSYKRYSATCQSSRLSRVAVYPQISLPQLPCLYSNAPELYLGRQDILTFWHSGIATAQSQNSKNLFFGTKVLIFSVTTQNFSSFHLMHTMSQVTRAVRYVKSIF